MKQSRFKREHTRHVSKEFAEAEMFMERRVVAVVDLREKAPEEQALSGPNAFLRFFFQVFFFFSSWAEGSIS